MTIYDSKKKDKAEKESEQVYVEMPDADVKQVSESKTHAYATFAENEKTQDIEDYWNQCNKQQEEVREQKKVEPQNHMFSSSKQTVTSPAPSRSAPSYNALYRETPQEREEELKSQREEDRVFIQRITHQLLRVRRTIKTLCQVWRSDQDRLLVPEDNTI